MLPYARRPGFPCSGTPASRHGPNRRTCLTAKRAPGRRVLLPGPHAMTSIHNFVILNEVNRCSPQTQRPLADFVERTRRRSQVNSAYRCLTALRLSLSSLLGRVRLRPLRSLRSSIRSARHVICSGCRTDAGTSAKQGGEQRGQTSVQAESGIFLVRAGASPGGGPQACPAGSGPKIIANLALEHRRLRPGTTAASGVRQSAKCRVRPKNRRTPFGRAKICRTRPATTAAAHTNIDRMRAEVCDNGIARDTIDSAHRLRKAQPRKTGTALKETERRVNTLSRKETGTISPLRTRHPRAGCRWRRPADRRHWTAGLRPAHRPHPGPAAGRRCPAKRPAKRR